MPTIKDLAREAGVSVTTASYSLNDTGRISEITRQKVLQTAKRIGYVPSISARSLKGHNIRAVGIFVDGIAGPVYGAIIEGAQDKFKSEGWGLIVGTLNSPIQELARSLVSDSLLAGSIILNGGMLAEEAILPLLKKAPVVVLDIHKEFLEKASKKNRLCRIEIDNKKGMNALFEEVLRRKCRRILFLEGPSSSWDFMSRKKALFELCRKERLPEPGILSCDYKAHGAYDLVKTTIDRELLYDCILAANDEMAMGAMKALKEAGLKIPEDIIVMGFDDIEAAHWVDPPLTTVKVDYKKLGKLLGEKMLQMIQSKKPVCENLIFPVEFTGRQSTGFI